MYFIKSTKILSLAIVFILLLGISYEQIMRQYTHKTYTAKGEFFQINGSKIHAIVKGKNKQKPTVVFLAGYYPTGASSLIWDSIETEISKHTKTISYDRPGILWSTHNYEPTIESTLKDLHELLRQIDDEGSYILVGHSISGMVARAFAEKYPNLVHGLVLIDASHPEAQNKIPKEILGKSKDRNYAMISFLSSIGYIRLVDSFTYPNTLKTDTINQISNAFFPEKINSILKSKSLKNDWADRIKHQASFKDLPIKIIAASGDKVIQGFSSKQRGELFNKIWTDLQIDLKSLSSNSELTWAKNSGHYIPLEQPNLVINTILKILKETEKTYTPSDDLSL